MLQLRTAAALGPRPVRLSGDHAHGVRLGRVGSVRRTQRARGPRALPGPERAGLGVVGRVCGVAPRRRRAVGRRDRRGARRVRAVAGATATFLEQDVPVRWRVGRRVRGGVRGVRTWVERRRRRWGQFGARPSLIRETRRPPWGYCRHMHTRAAALSAAGLLAGCYSYAPLATATPEPGTSLEATLTD